MKRVQSATLALLLLLILTACDQTQNTPSTPSPTPSAQITPSPEPEPDPEPLGLYQADVTHNGTDDWLEIFEENGVYTFFVRDGATGGTLHTVETNTSHAGWNAVYLCERDGLQYLLEWLPGGSTGLLWADYQVYSLAPEGEKVVLEEDHMEWDTEFYEHFMELDVGALRAFEEHINDLLADSALLLSVTDSVYINPGELTNIEPVNARWDSQADLYEQWQNDPELWDARQ